MAQMRRISAATSSGTSASGWLRFMSIGMWLRSGTKPLCISAHIERAIAHARERVERQQALIARMRLRGHDTRAAEILADLLARTLHALLTYRRLAGQGMGADG